MTIFLFLKIYPFKQENDKENGDIEINCSLKIKLFLKKGHAANKI